MIVSGLDVLECLKDNIFKSFKTSLIAIVTEVNVQTKTIKCQPILNKVLKDNSTKKLPQLSNVPYFINTPKTGDLCLIIILDLNTTDVIKNYKYTENVPFDNFLKNPVDLNRHNLNNAVAICGLEISEESKFYHKLYEKLNPIISKDGIEKVSDWLSNKIIIEYNKEVR